LFDDLLGAKNAGVTTMELGATPQFFGADPRWSCCSWVCLADKIWSGVVFLSEAAWSSAKHALRRYTIISVFVARVKF
jgi:hypothetical protein